MKKLTALLLALLLSCSVFPALAVATLVTDDPVADLPPEQITLQDALGVIQGNVYKNAYLGIGFILPQDQPWRFYTEEEIIQTNSLAVALVSGELKDIMEQSQNITVMSATTEEGFPNLNIQILDIGESLSLVQLLGFDMILSLQIDSLKEMLEESGLTDVELSVDTLVIDGEEVTCLRTKYTYWIFTVYSVEACLVRGDYVVYVTATAEEEGVADRVFDNLFWIP